LKRYTIFSGHLVILAASLIAIIAVLRWAHCRSRPGDSGDDGRV